MLVLVRPVYNFLAAGRLFDRAHDYAASWMDPYVRLRDLGRERGVELATWDRHPLSTADVVLVQDLPLRRAEILRAKADAPRAAFVLQLLESPIIWPYGFNPANHRDFDAVLTYDPHLCDETRYFHYDLPVGRPQGLPDPPFVERKPMVLVNSDRRVQRFVGRHAFTSGWHFRWSDRFANDRGELYTRRRALARLADGRFPGLLDIYGPGWDRPPSWLERLRGVRPLCGWKAGRVPKFDVLPHYRFGLAFENYRGDRGYVSEKPYDCLFAGVVPVYLGDERIGDALPADAFVDARRFRSDRQLLEYVRDCPETEWAGMRAAGRAFLDSPAARRVSPDVFAERVLTVIAAAAGRNL